MSYFLDVCRGKAMFVTNIALASMQFSCHFWPETTSSQMHHKSKDIISKTACFFNVSFF
jgi:hypothetical protein